MLVVTADRCQEMPVNVDSRPVRAALHCELKWCRRTLFDQQVSHREDERINTRSFRIEFKVQLVFLTIIDWKNISINMI